MANSSWLGRTRRVATVLLVLALGQAGPGHSATLTVSPVRLDLGPKAASQLLTLGNETDREIRFEVSSFAWTESERGEMVLAPTEDLVVFPLLSAIAPRSTRTVRVGLARRAASPQERTYRVFFQELAPPRTASDAGAVMMQMRIGIPVFVAPPKPRGSAVIESPSFSAGKLRFRLLNPGNSHISLRSVSVTAVGPGGAFVGAHDLPAWYLLAGGVRLYDLAIEATECVATAELVISARWSDGSASGRLDVPAGACQ